MRDISGKNDLSLEWINLDIGIHEIHLEMKTAVIIRNEHNTIN